MTDTRNEARVEILERMKADIDSKIEAIRSIRELAPTQELWDRWDREIDLLLCEKDNLSVEVPQYMEEDEGHGSPYISGGEVTYPTPYRPAVLEWDENIPF